MIKESLDKPGFYKQVRYKVNFFIWVDINRGNKFL